MISSFYLLFTIPLALSINIDNKAKDIVNNNKMMKSWKLVYFKREQSYKQLSENLSRKNSLMIDKDNLFLYLIIYFIFLSKGKYLHI